MGADVVPASDHSPIGQDPQVVSSVLTVESDQRPLILPGQVQRRRPKVQQRDVALRHPEGSFGFGCRLGRLVSGRLQRQGRSAAVTVCVTWTVSETREAAGVGGQRGVHEDYGKRSPPQTLSFTFSLSLSVSLPADLLRFSGIRSGRRPSSLFA